MAADRYAEIADDVICTMSWVDENAPSPVVFGVDAEGARIIVGDLVKSADREAAYELATSASGQRFAAITAAAVAVGNAIPRAVAAAPSATGPERVQAAVTSDRGGSQAPDTPVGFGR